MFDYRDIVEYLLILFHKKPLDEKLVFPHSFTKLKLLESNGCGTTAQIASGNNLVYVEVYFNFKTFRAKILFIL